MPVPTCTQAANKVHYFHYTLLFLLLAALPAARQLPAFPFRETCSPPSTDGGREGCGRRRGPGEHPFANFLLARQHATIRKSVFASQQPASAHETHAWQGKTCREKAALSVPGTLSDGWRAARAAVSEEAPRAPSPAHSQPRPVEQPIASAKASFTFHIPTCPVLGSWGLVMNSGSEISMCFPIFGGKYAFIHLISYYYLLMAKPPDSCWQYNFIFFFFFNSPNFWILHEFG